MNMKSIPQQLKNEFLNTAWKSALTVIVALFGNGCGPESIPPPPADDSALIKGFFKEHPEIESLFVKPATTGRVDFHFNVYVDHSASIHGYLNLQSQRLEKNGTGKAVPHFFNLLRQLSNRGELLGFNAFGTLGEKADSTDEEITPLGRVPPTDASAYKRLNNDYASLIRKIKTEQPHTSDGKPVQHVIITDGVQSHRDPGNGSALSKTVKELQAWIDSGGAVDIRVSISAFAGKYYSEELRALRADQKNQTHSFSGNVTDRPFLIISLLQSPEHLPSWQQFWSSSGLATIPVEALASFPPQVPDNAGFAMKPEAQIDKKMAPEMLLTSIWEKREVVTIENASNLFAARILRPQNLRSEIVTKYPILITIEGSGANVTGDFKASHPMLQIWRNDGKKTPQLTGPDESKANQPSAEAPARIWKQLVQEEMAGVPTDLRETFTADPSPVSKTDKGLNFTIRAPLQSRGMDHILVLTTEQTLSASTPPDFSKFSCTDDSSPDSLNRIYNLQQLVEQFSHGMKPVSRKSGLLILTHY